MKIIGFNVLLLFSYFSICSEVPYEVLLGGPVDTNRYLLKVPDTESITVDWVINRFERKAGKAVVKFKGLFSSDSMRDFTAGERATSWAEKQGAFPKAIFLLEGHVSLEMLFGGLLPKNVFSRLVNGDCLLKAPLVIEAGASLEINSKYCRRLLLSKESGSFIVVSGGLMVNEANILAWSERKKSAASYVRPSDFRPFLTSWGGSQLLIVNSTISSLGYHMSKSYGITVSQFSKKIGKLYDTPESIIIGSSFVDMYYGFYCYHTDNIIISKNSYIDNIVYGIDPHDFSNGLLIFGNVVRGTKKKHGIIVSRSVTNSWIINNVSYDNNLSGIVIDRSSGGNYIGFNEVFNNGSDGITIYESPGNVVYKNKVYMNHKHGVRARNSTDIKIIDNKIFSNGRYGIYGHVKKLDNTGRNLELDPYKEEISLTVVGGEVGANKRGSFHIDKPLSIKLYDVDFRFNLKYDSLHISGVLEGYYKDIIEAIYVDKKSIEIRPLSN